MLSGEIVEASGLVVSARNPGVAWVHNDSGDSARVFAVDLATGEVRAVLTYSDDAVVDVEDMAIDDAGGWLLLGDVGDNAWARDHVSVYRVREPRLGPLTVEARVASERMDVAIPGGPEDAETLLFDPPTGSLYLVTKHVERARVLALGPFAAGALVVPEDVAVVRPPYGAMTAGDVSRDGRLVAMRDGAERVFLWRRADGERLEDAVLRPPCVLAAPASGQAEGLGFLPDGRGFATVSEGPGERVYLYALEGP